MWSFFIFSQFLWNHLSDIEQAYSSVQQKNSIEGFYICYRLEIWEKELMHNIMTSLVTLTLKIQGQIIKFRTISFFKVNAMLWIGVDLCNSIFNWNLKWSMSSVTLTHTDLDLCFQGHIRKKWMHNITLVNITIQPYFVISYKNFAMHLCSNYGILLPLKHLSFTDWKNKIYFLYKDNKIFK